MTDSSPCNIVPESKGKEENSMLNLMESISPEDMVQYLETLI